MANRNTPEKPADYFRMKKAYYELGIHQQLGLASHSLFLALLHKANDLHFRRYFRMSGKELADLAVLSERAARIARDKLVQFTIQKLPLVLYWSGHRGRSPTYAIIYEQLNLTADYEQVKKKIEELRSAMSEIEELNAANFDVDNFHLAESNAAIPHLAESSSPKDRGTTCRYPPLSGSDSGTRCRDPNKTININIPTPCNMSTSMRDEEGVGGGEGIKILSKRKKTEKEIRDVVANLKKHGVKNGRTAKELALKYETGFIYRHIMQLKHDYSAGQRWKDPGGIIVARIRKGEPTPDFPADNYLESSYEDHYSSSEPSGKDLKNPS